MPSEAVDRLQSAAAECFRQGDLSEAQTALQSAIRASPADPKPRIFLAQLLMVLGDWERALTQLQVIAELDASALPMAHAYAAAIRCERLRADVFAGKRGPILFGEPETWIVQLVESLSALASGRAAEAAAMRSAALDAAPAVPGQYNGTRFSWLADADSRLGPVLEVLLNGAYYWVPLHRVASVTAEAPADIRDLVWLPANFRWVNGGEAVGLIPTRYPGTESVADSGLRLARRTEWQDLGDDTFIGSGQRVFTTDVEEFALLDLRTLSLDPPS